MLIGIDGNEANVEKRVGVNMYAFDLLWSIYRLLEKRQKGVKPISLVIYLKNPPQKDLPKEKDWWRYRVLQGRGIWIITKLMPHLLLTKDKPDVLFSPSHYVPPLAPMPRVCSIMDLGYLESTAQFRKYDFWQLKYWTAISVYVSKRIIAISNSTKKDIVRHYPFASGKVEVTHPAYDRDRFNTKILDKDVRRVKKKHSIANDYVLFLSTLKPSKNIEGLLEAFLDVKKRFPEIKLVISGKKGWLYRSIFEKVKKLALTSSVIFTGYIPEVDKPFLIKGAKVFVMPSFWEGFGLDPLYAMASGVPVVVSNKGSLPEVVGDAGILFDPEKTSDISKALIKVLSMSQKRYNRLIKEGLKQADKFSWEKTATKVLEILEFAA